MSAPRPEPGDFLRADPRQDDNYEELTWTDSVKETGRCLFAVYRHSLVTGFGVCLFFLAEFGVVMWGSMSASQDRVFLLWYLNFNNCVLYFGLWACFAAIFSFSLARRAIFLVGFPCILINAALLQTGLYFNQLFFHGQYILFLVHHYFILRTIRTYAESEKQTSQTEPQVEAQVEAQVEPHVHPRVMFLDMATDGTPQALFKGMLIIVGFYAVFANIIWPIFDRGSILTKVILRACVFPSVFGMLIFVQYLLFLGKSLPMMQYRQIQAATANSLLVIIGRLMITNAESQQTIAILSIATGLVELVSRMLYPYRYLLVQYLHEKRRQLLKRNYVEPTNVRVNSSAQGSLGDVHIDEAGSQAASQSTASHPDSRANINSATAPRYHLSGYVRYFRGQQIVTNLSTEARVLFTTPVLLFFMHNLQYYYTIQFISAVEDVIIAIIIQLLVNFIIDFICMTVEIKRFGFRFDVSHLNNRGTNVVHMLILIGCTYLAFNSYRDRSKL